ncbi:DUF3793 family protein [Peptoniphilus equinus]|uniref:DUF3793 family protein n=1 Tax=Peptoniphilus equinus TaxID=3016343 RepID=A0ABY7QV65_9FIRM|nr:DUF3793 family protein [Peptoniphilus equinus]WBW49930.1 DUF3793 family protein [Peptoniphilus equinus]
MLWLKKILAEQRIHFFDHLACMEDANFLTGFLSYQTAPTKYCNKSATLVNLNWERRELLSHWSLHRDHMEAELGLRGYRIPNRPLVLFYHPLKLIKILKKPSIQKFLASLGYGQCSSLEEYLAVLGAHFEREQCPHEIGIFLGYPLDDVRAYMEGAACTKCVGYWKCYNKACLSKMKFFVYDLSKFFVAGQVLAQN